MKKELFDQRFKQLAEQLSIEAVEKITSIFEVKFNSAKGIQSYKLAAVQKILNRISIDNGSTELLVSQKLLIIGAILNNWYEFSSLSVDHPLRLEYESYLQRTYSFTDAYCEEILDNFDIFWKDFAIARLHIFPVHSGVVEFYSGFGLRQGLSGNLFQSIEFLLFIFKYGRKPYYRTHLHTPLLGSFSAEGWIKSYLQIAEMLKMDESIKGLARTSWYFDPKIKMISPHLSYLQELPLKNGAQLFCVGADNSGSALAKSQSRLTLYNKGGYAPMNYLLVWPRDVLIAWSEKHNRSRE